MNSVVPYSKSDVDDDSVGFLLQPFKTELEAIPGVLKVVVCNASLLITLGDRERDQYFFCDVELRGTQIRLDYSHSVDGFFDASHPRYTLSGDGDHYSNRIDPGNVVEYIVRQVIEGTGRPQNLGVLEELNLRVWVNTFKYRYEPLMCFGVMRRDTLR